MLADHIGVPHLRDLASRSERFTTSVKLSEMHRLAELLHPGSGTQDDCLELEIQFHGGMEGFPELRGHLSGQLALLCQRCLGRLDWTADERFELVVVNSEQDFDDIIEPFDSVVAGERGICLAEIVEDELLASLPLAPMHEVGDCEPAYKIEVSDDALQEPEVETNKPFEGLAQLLQDAGPSQDKN